MTTLPSLTFCTKEKKILSRLRKLLASESSSKRSMRRASSTLSLARGCTGERRARPDGAASSQEHDGGAHGGRARAGQASAGSNACSGGSSGEEAEWSPGQPLQQKLRAEMATSMMRNSSNLEIRMTIPLGHGFLTDQRTSSSSFHLVSRGDLPELKFSPQTMD